MDFINKTFANQVTRVLESSVGLVGMLFVKNVVVDTQPLEYQ